MDPRRLAVVTRRFWPFCGPTEISAGEIAGAIQRAGHSVQILTVRWEKHWPRDFTFREIEVRRLGRPVNGPWGTFRFLRSFSRHLRESNLDGLVVMGLQDEAWAAIRSAIKHCPVVVHIDQGDMNSQTRDHFNSRQLAALNSVARIVVDSEHTKSRLLKSNQLDPDSIVVVGNTIEISSIEPRSLEKQNLARTSLSDAHPILIIDENQPLVVCAAPLEGDQGLIDLVNAWPRVLDQTPNARMWILGDGSRGREVWERICELNLAHSIIMPGFFDDLGDVFQAADLFVHPLQSDASCGCLMRALAAGTCTVATKLPTHLELIEKNVNGLLAPVHNPTALAEAINLALKKLPLRKRLGESAQAQAKAFDVDLLIGAYLDPFLIPSEHETQIVEK